MFRRLFYIIVFLALLPLAIKCIILIALGICMVLYGVFDSVLSLFVE